MFRRVGGEGGNHIDEIIRPCSGGLKPGPLRVQSVDKFAVSVVRLSVCNPSTLWDQLLPILEHRVIIDIDLIAIACPLLSLSIPHPQIILLEHLVFNTEFELAAYFMTSVINTICVSSDHKFISGIE